MAVGNKESANFFRLIKVIVDVGSEVMRDVIRQKVLPDTLGNVVQTNIAKIDRLKKNNILFNEQYNLLTQVPPDPEKFDISLLRIILRNICPNVPAPMHGWGEDPDPTDFSLGADILRLQKFRNTISAHTPNTRMTDVDFENTWLDVRTVIVRVSNHGSLQNVAGRIDAVKTEHLDPLRSQMQKLLKVFCDWQKQNEMDQTILEKLEKQDHKLDKVLERVGVNNDSDVGYEDIPKVCKCNKVMKVQDSEAASFKDNNDCVPADTKWVCLIKIYPWIKEEMCKPMAMCIAAQLRDELHKDHIESIENSMQRRMAVDKLLKHVLRINKTYPSRIEKFWKKLEGHFESADAFSQTMSKEYPTEDETKDCLERNRNRFNASRCNRSCVDEFRLQKEDKKIIHDNIKDVLTIDTLNNNLLSKFYFSIAEHERVSVYLPLQDFVNGATHLLETLEQCPKMVAHVFCDTLESLDNQYCLVQDLHLKDKYCMPDGTRNENTQHITNEDRSFLYKAGYKCKDRLKEWCHRAFGFFLTEIRRGSIILHLRPESEESWKHLETLCSSGQIIQILDIIFECEKVPQSLADAERKILLSVHCEANPNSSEAVKKLAILTIEFTSWSEEAIKETSYTDRNPLDDNLDLFAEELEVCDELIQLLKVKELIPSNTEETLRKTKSRASEIRCLLKLISSPETGYAAIKEYLVDANKYLHKQLLEREEKLPTRELFFQCKVQYRRSVSEQRGHLKKSDIQNPEYYWDLIEPICFFKKELLGCWTEMEHDDPLIKDAPITQEHLNHMRLCHALVTVCADALRDILLNQIPPGYPDFYQLLLARKAALQGMRQFRPEQIGILYPDPQNLKTGTVDQFDITLLYALIRFVSAVVPPGTGWGRPPDDNPRDTSLGASVERMRLLRNTVVGKSVDNKVDEQTFENTWDAITQITDDIENVIGDKGYKAALMERKNQTITLGRRTKNAEEI